jgi:hypothetical protein
MYIAKLIDHIAKELGASESANIAFKLGYLESMMEDIISRVPEARELVEYHAAAHGFVEEV